MKHKNVPPWIETTKYFKTRGCSFMNPSTEKLCRKYINNPPSEDIRSMSGEALLDMNYFLNEEEPDDDFGEEGFYIF